MSTWPANAEIARDVPLVFASPAENRRLDRSYVQGWLLEADGRLAAQGNCD